MRNAHAVEKGCVKRQIEGMREERDKGKESEREGGEKERERGLKFYKSLV